MSFKYLEDFLEYSEELPNIFRERLTRVREMDLEVNNRRDNLKKLKETLRVLRREKAHKADPLYKNSEINAVCREMGAEWNTIVDLSTSKVLLVDSLEVMMKRLNAHLETETEKFKLELEADNPGSTAKLEARALEEMQLAPKLDVPMIQSTGIRLKSSRPSKLTKLDDGRRQPTSFATTSERLRISAPERSDMAALMNVGDRCMDAATQTLTGAPSLLLNTGSSNSSAGHKYALDDPHLNQCLHLMDISAASVAIAGSSNRPKRDFRPTRRAAKGYPVVGSTRVTAPEEEDESSQEYCFCRNTKDASEFMVACDNPECHIEWFHGECVGISSESEIKGKSWYCPTCASSLKLDERAERAVVPSRKLLAKNMVGLRAGLVKTARKN